MTSRRGRSTGAALRALCWLLSLLLLVCSSSGYGQVPPTSEPSPTSIENVLNSLTRNSKRLAQQLEKQKISYEQAEKQVSELLRELSVVKSSLEESLARLNLSEAEVQRLTTLLQQSDETLTSLRTSFEEYRKAVFWQLISTGILAFILGAAAGLAAGIILE